MKTLEQCLILMCGLLVATVGSAFAQEEPLVVVDGRPTLQSDQQRIATAYSETYLWDKAFQKRTQDFARAGVNLFTLTVASSGQSDFFTTHFWASSDQWSDEAGDESDESLDQQAGAILKVNPEARFIVRWCAIVPEEFTQRHPEQMQRRADGSTTRESSFASSLATQGLSRMARQVVDYCETRPWAGRVIGYAVFPVGEGHSLIANELFDQSAAMRLAFQAYLKEVYSNDEALRIAWNDPKVTLDTAATPTLEGWRADRESWLHWPRPQQTRMYRDYFALQRVLLRDRYESQARAVRKAADRQVLVAFDMAKQPMFGWLIEDAFSAAGRGMAFPNVHLAAGSIGMGDWLDATTVDALITPADYTARSVGFGFEGEGLSDSLVLRGKTLLLEDDARSYLGPEADTQGAWRDLQEARHGMLRNFMVSASRGLFPYWMNVSSTAFWDDPGLMKLVAEQIPVRERTLAQPLAPTQHAIALVIDDTSPMHEDFTAGFQHLAVLRQRTDQLALTGLPYRVYLFSDLQRDDFPRFRCYLFPNLFKLDPQRIGLIRDKVLRDGSVAIFGPATGITDGQGYAPHLAEQLLGFPMQLVEKTVARRVHVAGQSHPALADLGTNLVYGDSFAYGPILQPAADLGAGVELGRGSLWFQSNRAGLVLREFGRGAAGNGKQGPRGEGDGAAVFSVATPLPAAVLRSLALYGGCNPWAELGDVVGASGSMLGIHSARPGPRSLYLPRPSRVTDAKTGQIIGDSLDQFEVTLSPGETRLFLLDPSD